MSPAPSEARAPLSHLRHDLRTPINQIIGYSELLAEEALDAGHDAYAPDLQKINGAARALLALINANLTDDRLTLNGAVAAGAALAPSPAAAEPAESAAADDPSEGDPRPAPTPGRILVVDDQEGNREVLRRQLVRQGHTVTAVEHGQAALEALRGEPFDLVLLDMMMPVLDGYSTLVEIKNDPAVRHLPVIMISALDELGSVVRCIERGAEDYLPKPFNPTLLRARIGAGLEKKRFRDQERQYVEAIERTQRRLHAELAEAENYVRSILPAPLTTGPVHTDWRLVPSTELGGDSFGYHWIDDDHLAVYLLDVCGHGVGAALLSVTAINVLRNAALPAVDFRDPGAVLTALNEAFLMEKQNGMYFTVWYAVWRPSTRTLCFASAGHPPAVLVTNREAERRHAEVLKGGGLILGGMSGVRYRSFTATVDRPAVLYVVSDGTFEITRPDGSMWSFAALQEYLGTMPAAGEADLDRLFSHVKELHGSDSLEDDFSIMRLAL
ncbi:SpoIIE family protein phosphatase [Opitutus sp. ER46]|uniref:SpoIIE family protein phosphatase n=1 Tax=Opitutus sp. ER46 TaxID=2161864 RepID=UPI000D3191D7|nr:SpoIIE family protein phosphatase [Opitutus sp. ER46]PTX91746.1 serine/threonine protein phosphatase [Opitutus sp. ER46]